jgi:DNA-binding LacI/PurR family transcriptional regulator
VDHLAALGHRRIGFIGWAEGRDLGDDRFRGWVEGAAEHRLPTRGLCGRGSDDIASAEELADSLLSQRQPPTAFVCVSDTMAMGVMRAIEHRGLRVGRDVSVVGFEDCSLAAVVRPGLTRVRQPLMVLAEKAIDHLVGQIDGDRVRPLRLIVAPTRVIRESSAPAA